MNTCCARGVYGAKIALYPMQDKFVDVLLSAIKETDQSNLAIITDDLGTTVQGSKLRVFSYLRELIGRTFLIEGHTTANLLLSFGCEGDVPEVIPQDIDEDEYTPWNDGDDTPVACSWSYYPLGQNVHLDIIEKSIARVKEYPAIKLTRAHYSTRLDGSLGMVMSAMEDAFQTSVNGGIHTVFHLTLSKGSPSEPGKVIQ